jgi:Tfp pilus assembly protein PilF
LNSGHRLAGILAGMALAVVSLSLPPVLAGTRSRSSGEGEAVRHFRLGQLEYEQGKTQEAIASIRKALKLDPDNAEAHNYLGLIFLQQSDLKTARKEFKKAVQINPYYSDAHNNLGVAFKESKKYDAALKEFQAALNDRTYKTPEKVHLNMGHVFLAQGKYPEAIKAFELALAADPKYLRGMVGLGMALQRSGKDDRARQEFLKVVRLDPNSPEAREARALLDAQVKRDVP